MSKKISGIAMGVSVVFVIWGLIVYSDNQDLKYKINKQNEEIRIYKEKIQSGNWRYCDEQN